MKLIILFAVNNLFCSKGRIKLLGPLPGSIHLTCYSVIGECNIMKTMHVHVAIIFFVQSFHHSESAQ